MFSHFRPKLLRMIHMVYMSEFIPAPETEEETEETSAEDDFGMEGMDLGEDMAVEG